MLCIGTPGKEPRLYASHTGLGNFDVREGEVSFDAPDQREYERRLISTDEPYRLVAFVYEAAELRTVKLNKLKRTRRHAMYRLGCWTPKGRMDTSNESQSLLALHAARAGVDADHEVHWTMHDNSDVLHSAADILAAHAAMVSFSAAVHRQYRRHRAALEAATSADEIEAIDIAEGWPEVDEPV